MYVATYISVALNGNVLVDYNYVCNKHTTKTYVGLLHCLSLYLTPIPQDLVQAENGANADHCPSTGVKSVELGMQLPRTQI